MLNRLNLQESERRSGEVADREDGADRRHDQAAWLRGAKPGRQLHGGNSSIRWAGCPYRIHSVRIKRIKLLLGRKTMENGILRETPAKAQAIDLAAAVAADGRSPMDIPCFGRGSSNAQAQVGTGQHFGL